MYKGQVEVDRLWTTEYGVGTVQGLLLVNNAAKQQATRDSIPMAQLKQFVCLIWIFETDNVDTSLNHDAYGNGIIFTT